MGRIFGSGILGIICWLAAAPEVGAEEVRAVRGVDHDPGRLVVARHWLAQLASAKTAFQLSSARA